MDSFGALLKSFRLNHSRFSQTSLAKAIDVSQRYISQIELGISAPPSYQVCLKLCDVLSLTSSQKNSLLRSAAVDRFYSHKANLPFKNYLPSFMPTTAKEPSSSEGALLVTGYGCRYSICWETVFKYPYLQDYEAPMTHFIEDLFLEFDCKCLQLKVSSCQVSCIVDCDYAFDLKRFVDGLKRLSSAHFLHQFPETDLSTKEIWEPGAIVYTLTSSLDLATDSPEQSMQHFSKGSCEKVSR